MRGSQPSVFLKAALAMGPEALEGPSEVGLCRDALSCAPWPMALACPTLSRGLCGELLIIVSARGATGPGSW